MKKYIMYGLCTLCLASLPLSLSGCFNLSDLLSDDTTEESQDSTQLENASADGSNPYAVSTTDPSLIPIDATTDQNDIISDNTEDSSEESTENIDLPTEVVYPLTEGGLAPTFTADLVGGGSFSLSDQKGKVVVLNFWATWCGPCVGEMPAFQRLYEEYPDQVSIIAVNCMEDNSTVDAFISKKGYTFPVAYDYYGTINDMYPTDGIPYTIIIDSNGIIQNIFIGAYDAESQYREYKSAIEPLLK